MAILLGLLAANTVGTAAVFRPGLAFAVKRMLRLGIILVGIRLSFFDVVKLGAWGIPVVATIILVALLRDHTASRARSAFRTSSATLAAASTAICGVTAALSVGPVIEAEESEVAYTVANVTLFGLVAMLDVPLPRACALRRGLRRRSASSSARASTTRRRCWARRSRTRTSFDDERALQVATVTKLTRNVFLVAVVPALAYLHARRTGHAGGQVSVARLFPLFVLGFLGHGDRPVGRRRGARVGRPRARGLGRAPGGRASTKMVGETWGSAALGTAMAGVGLSTNLKAFRAMGFKPLYRRRRSRRFSSAGSRSSLACRSSALAPVDDHE